MHRSREVVPVVVVELAFSKLLRVNAAYGRHEALRKLLGAHFHGKDRNRQLLIDADVFCNVERKRRLAHGRTASNDDEVAPLQAGRHVVKIAVAS